MIMPFISVNDFTDVYDETVDTGAENSAKYIGLLNKIKQAYDDNPSKKTEIDSQIKMAIREYFSLYTDAPDQETVIKRLEQWALILQTANELSLTDVNPTNKELYRLLSTELMLSTSLITKFRSPAEVTRCIANVIFSDPFTNLSVLSEILKHNPALLASPIITHIQIYDFKTYTKRASDINIHDFLETMRSQFRIHIANDSLNLATNKDTLIGWTIFWITQATTPENLDTLQQLVSKYYTSHDTDMFSANMVYGNMLKELIEFADSKKLNIYDLLGKILLLKFRGGEYTEIRRFLTRHFKDETQSTQLVSLCLSIYREDSHLEQSYLRLLRILPLSALNNEELLHAILTTIINHDYDERLNFLEALPLLSEVCKELSKVAIHNPNDVIETIRTMKYFFDLDFQKIGKSEANVLIMAIKSYFSMPSRKEMLLQRMLDKLDNNDLSMNYLKLLSVLPATGDERVVNMLCKLIISPHSDDSLKALCSNTLSSYILALNASQLLTFVKSIKEHPALIRVFLITTIMVLDKISKTPNALSNIENLPYTNTAIQSEISKLERENSSALRSIADKYPLINLGSLLLNMREFFSIKAIEFQRATTQDEKQSINSEFCEHFFERVKHNDSSSMRRLELIDYNSFLEDLIQFDRICKLDTLFTQFNHASNAATARSATTDQTISDRFVSTIIDAATKEEAEEVEKSSEELFYSELTAAEKSEIQRILKQQLEKLSKRFANVESYNQHLQNMFDNLRSVADLGKYLRPNQRKKSSSSSSALSRIDSIKTMFKIDRMLVEDFPIKQELPTDIKSGRPYKRLQT